MKDETYLQIFRVILFILGAYLLGVKITVGVILLIWFNNVNVKIIPVSENIESVIGENKNETRKEN